jgi:hypothetical protein
LQAFTAAPGFPADHCTICKARNADGSELIEQFRNMLDFSASTPTNSSGASAPRRVSSLGAYDHGRASAATSIGGPS